MTTPSVIAALRVVCPGGVQTSVDLSARTRWRVGGLADCLVEPATVCQLAGTIQQLNEFRVPWAVLGATSNLLFSDAGLRAVGVVIGERLSGLSIRGNDVSAQAGIAVPWLARRLASAGLTGCEHTVGIPGSLGGLVCMNGGSNRQNIGQHVQRVDVLRRDGTATSFDQQACAFDYRSSRFQDGQHVITGVHLRLQHSPDLRAARRTMLSTLRDRRARFPLKQPNCGSVFVSDPALYALAGPPGRVIEQCGLKGKRIGGAQVSHQHANFIITEPGCRAADVLELIEHVRETVRGQYGISLRSEVRLVDPDGWSAPAGERDGHAG